MRSCLIALSVIASMALLAGQAYPEGRNGGPPIKRDCDSCHAPHKMGEPMLLKALPSELCLDCHPQRKPPAEHVVDVVPSMRVSNLPLDDAGEMTCVTCHDPHGKEGFPKMLREKPSLLCGRCHRM